FTMLLNPEMLDELGRVNGQAFAWTGLGKYGEAEYVWIIDAGSSNLPGLSVRLFQTIDAGMRVVATVDGGRGFRERDFWRERDRDEGRFKDKFDFKDKEDKKGDEGAEESGRFPPDDLGKPGEPIFRGPVLAVLPNKGIVLGSNVAVVGDVVRRALG